MSLSFITWNANPEIFSIGSFSLRWYGLSWALSFFLGYLLFLWFLKRENRPVSLLDSLTTYMILGTVIGSRLGHCLFYEPARYLAHPIEILKVWNGGMASHGAGLGIILAIYIFSIRKKEGFFNIFDRVVICAALAGFLIRMGNLMNSEIVGMPSDLPWAFVFSNATGFDKVPRHPAQLYEALWCIIVFALLLYMYIKKHNVNRDGLLFGIFIFAIFTFRFFIEFIKEKQVSFESHLTLNMGQLLSIPFALAGLALILYKTKYKTKTTTT